MADDAVSKAVAGAKDALAKANRFTQSVTGNSTNAFAPKKPEAPKIPQAHAQPSYSLARELNAKKENVDQYVNAPK